MLVLRIQLHGISRLLRNQHQVHKHLVAFGSSWKYLDNGSNQGTAWAASSFNDAIMGQW